MIARSPSMGIIYQHVLINVFYLVFSTVLHLDQKLLPRPSILGLELVGINPFSLRPKHHEDSLQVSELGIVEDTQSLVHPAVIVNINLCRNRIFKSWKSRFGQRTIIEQFRRQQQHNQGNQRDGDDFLPCIGETLHDNPRYRGETPTYSAWSLHRDSCSPPFQRCEPSKFPRTCLQP